MSFNTYGHGVEESEYEEDFDSVAELNEALLNLDEFYNLPYSWRYYEDEGVAVEIFMPRRGKVTTFRVRGVSSKEADKLDRTRIRNMISEHTREEHFE